MLNEVDQGEQQKQGLEEQYERMHPKMARDFVSREDFEDVLVLLNLALSALAAQSGAVLPVKLTLSNTKAMAKSILYKQVVESGKDGSKLFKDLVEID